MGVVSFGIPKELALWAKEEFGLRAFIETGTNQAGTTVWASEHFPRVASIEGQADLHAAAVANHGHRGIDFVHGDSGKVLADVLKKVGEPAVLWLDAHWCGEGTFGPKAECPLIDEIRMVNESSPDHVILIDDARLFLWPPPPPHNAQDWPDLIAIGAELAKGKTPRYSVVFEDVIVAVPMSGREKLVEFVRRPRPQNSVKARARSLARNLAVSVLDRIDAVSAKSDR